MHVAKAVEGASHDRGMTVVHEAGDRFSVEIRGHELVIDQPVSDGGTDRGPAPVELLVASLASCIAHYGRRFLVRHGLPETIAVTADWEMAKSPNRIGSMKVTVDAPGLPLEMYSRFEQVIAHCTVHNTLMDPPEISLHTVLLSQGKPA
jgi:uncharacterized OsmC-like protein